MRKHTPGPWHKSRTHLGAAFDIGAANGANVALVSGPKENGADEFEGNADLIIAAPDLLAAAKVVLQGLVERQTAAAQARSPIPVFSGIAALHAAIEAAEGAYDPR